MWPFKPIFYEKQPIRRKLVEEAGNEQIGSRLAGRTGDQFTDFIVGRFPEEAEQGGHAAAVPQRHLVVVGGLAVHQVPQGPTGALLDLGHLVIQEVDEVLDPSQVTNLQSRSQELIIQLLLPKITHIRLSFLDPNIKFLFFTFTLTLAPPPHQKLWILNSSVPHIHPSNVTDVLLQAKVLR